MSLLKCPECKKKISETAVACPKCGKVFANGKLVTLLKRKRKIRNRLLIVCTILIVAMIPFVSSNENKETNTASAKQHLGMKITSEDFSRNYNNAVNRFKLNKGFKILKITKEADHTDFLLNSHSIARAYLMPNGKTISYIEFLTDTSRSIKGSSAQCIELLVSACVPSLSVLEASVLAAELMQVIVENGRPTDKPNVRKVGGVVFSSVNKPSEHEISIFVKNEADE